MRSGAAAGHRGYFHETAFYGSDDDLMAMVVPFLTEGVAAGEPVVVAFAERNAVLTRQALGDLPGVTFVANVDQYARPATAIRKYRAMFAELVAGGAAQIRVVGDVPHPGSGAGWNGWARYEAVVNRAYDDFPIWGLCPYDTRTAPPEVLADVERTHPHLATTTGEHLANARFEEPATFLAGWPLPAPDPLQHREPDIVIANPTLAAARRAATTAGTAAGLAPDDLDGLALAVNELTADARRHGRGTLQAAMWVGPQRVVVEITEQGAGPPDPFAGLLPPDDGATSAGYGLWLAHQLLDEVVFGSSPQGFAVRVAAGAGGLTAGR